MTTTRRIVNGDVVLTAGGGHEPIEGTEKLRQGLRALLMLPSPQGAGLMEVLAPDGDDAIAVTLDLRRTIRAVVERYARTLRATQRQARTPGEQIREIKSILVQALEDPAALAFRLEVVAGNGAPVIVSGRRTFA